MPTSQKAKLKPLSMRTSKRVVHTEAARALGLNHLTNALDLKTDLVTGAATTGIEVMMTVEATGEVVVGVAPTSDLEDGLITEEEEGADIAADVEEGIMTEGIIVAEGEVTVFIFGGKESNKVLFDVAIFIRALSYQIVFSLIFPKRDGHHPLQSNLVVSKFLTKRSVESTCNTPLKAATKNTTIFFIGSERYN